MQNRYCCDVGDFGKYGLLRYLCREDYYGPALKLGLVWFLFPDESHNNDGKHTSYLAPTPKNRKEYRQCDPDLYDKLGELFINNNRDVQAIARSGVFFANTVFYDNVLSFEGMPGIGPNAIAGRIAHRSNWLCSAFESTKDCDLVFFDPDNGLETKTKYHHPTGPKFIFYDEIKPFIIRGQSVVVYHHICRQGTLDEQVFRRKDEFIEKLGVKSVIPVAFHRGSSRAFFIIPSADKDNILFNRAQSFISGPWGRHFSLALRMEKNDPIFGIIGLGKGGSEAVAGNYKDYLYGKMRDKQHLNPSPSHGRGAGGEG